MYTTCRHDNHSLIADTGDSIYPRELLGYYSRYTWGDLVDSIVFLEMYSFMGLQGGVILRTYH